MAQGPAETRAVWARHGETLRAVWHPTPIHQAGLASAERRLRALSAPITR